MARGRVPVKSNTTNVSLNDRFTVMRTEPKVNAVFKQRQTAHANVKSQKIISQMDKRPAVRAALQRIKLESQNQQIKASPRRKMKPGMNQRNNFKQFNSASPDPLSVKQRLQLPVKQRLQVRVKDRLSIKTNTAPRHVAKPVHGGFRTANAASAGSSWGNVNAKAAQGRGNVAAFGARKQKANFGAHLTNAHLQNGAFRNQGSRGRGTFQPRGKGNRGNNKKRA